MRDRPEGRARIIALFGRQADWWSQPGSNRRPSGCKPDALPAELWPRVNGPMALPAASANSAPSTAGRESAVFIGHAGTPTGGSGRSCTSDLTLIRGAL